LKAAILQSAYLGISSGRLDYYLRATSLKGVKVLLLGEYTLTRFFKELEKTPLSMLKEQSQRQIENLKELAKKYETVIVAPLISVKKGKIYKEVFIFFPGRTVRYSQQVLMPYPHWNERRFFANENGGFKEPPVFAIDGVKFGVMGGFEIHFNRFFDSFAKRGVHALLIPTVSTFGSNQRWREILKTRAFLSNCYLLRSNRIGEYVDRGVEWKFYGESMCVDPDGKIESICGDKEELLICEIDKERVKKSKKEWGFRALNRQLQ